MVTFNESLPFDKVLYKADIQASIVYAKALEQRKLLSEVESSQIVCGLQKVQEEWENGKMGLSKFTLHSTKIFTPLMSGG